MNVVKFLQVWKDKIVCVFVLKDQLSGNKGVVDEINSTTDDEHLKPNIHVNDKGDTVKTYWIFYSFKGWKWSWV